MANQWFKFYGTEYLSDPKMLSLSAPQRSCWVTLMCYASQSEDGVVRHLTEDQLMIQAGIDYTDSEQWNMCKGVLAQFEKLCMLTIDNGMITLCNWQKRQETSLTSYERVKKHRQMKQFDNARIEENRIDKNRIEHIPKIAFDEFWNLYPRKVNRKRSEQKWNSLEEPVQQLILATLPKQIASSQWQRDNGQYIPHPTTYLNNERWNDEVEIPKLREVITI
jgi:hypothetical protein